MARNNNYVETTTPIGTAIWVHLDKPDDEAPEGAKFTPDGKYKVTLLLSADEVGPVVEDIKRVAKVEWPTVDFDEVESPIKEFVPSEGFDQDGPMVKLTAKTKKFPRVVDSRGRDIRAEERVKGGDRGRAKVVWFPYERTVQVRDGKKNVNVTQYGVGARLNGFQVVSKRSAGSDFDVVEGGYEADDDNYQPPANRPSARPPVSDDDIPF